MKRNGDCGMFELIHYLVYYGLKELTGKRNLIRYFLIFIVGLVSVAGCSSDSMEAEGAQGVTAALIPSDTPLSIMPSPTNAPRPTRTSLAPTLTPLPLTITPSPIPKQPRSFVRQGTQIPQPIETISVENASQLAELARWGNGVIREAKYSPNGKRVAIVTSQGVFFYETNNYELVRFTEIDIESGPIALSNSLKFVAVGNWHGEISVWDTVMGI